MLPSANGPPDLLPSDTYKVISAEERAALILGASKGITLAPLHTSPRPGNQRSYGSTWTRPIATYVHGLGTGLLLEDEDPNVVADSCHHDSELTRSCHKADVHKTTWF
jgi:hypothetical protein